MAKCNDSKKACGMRETEICTKTTEYGAFSCDIKPGSRLYVGMRYTWKFSDPIEWNKSTPYEPLVVVQNNGYTYVSKKPVPANVEISNTDFWLLVADPNAQMEQLRQEVAENMEELREEVSGYTSAIEEASNIAKEANENARKYFKVLVVLGDSWSDETNDPSTSWLKRVSYRLGFEAYVTNAKGGVGFARGGDNAIPNQIAGALTKVQALGYTAEDVSHVIAIGGVNDYRRGETYGDTANGMKTTYNNVRSTFPNAQCEIIGCNAGKWDVMDTLDSTDPNKRASYVEFPRFQAYILNNLNNSGYPAPHYCADWLNWYGTDAANVFEPDTLHPNQTGHNIIAAHIQAILLGRPIRLHKQIFQEIKITVDNIERTLIVNGTIENGIMSLSLRYPAGQAIEGTTRRDFTIAGKEIPLVPGASNASDLPMNAVGFAVQNYNSAGVTDGLVPYKAAYFYNQHEIRFYPTAVMNDIFCSVTVPLY